MKILINHDSDDHDIEIERCDCFDCFTTLAFIIHPTLVKFKECGGGSGYIENADVPEELWSENENPIDVDEHWDARWQFVLDEMIWAFDQIKTYYFHYDSDKEKLARIDNGLRLFGKYYTNLWI